MADAAPVERAAQLAEIVHRWQGRRVLVLGDALADEHVEGRPLGIAREAPVLRLEHTYTRTLPGGATNVAANARALGAEVLVCGVVGDDMTGHALRATLEAMGMSCAGLLVDPERATVAKTRIWAGGDQQQVQQMLLRLDRVDRRPLSAAITERMATYLTQVIGTVDALLISDYENGVIHPGVIAASLPAALATGKIVAVDSHGDLSRFSGATLFTPNQPEAEAALGRAIGGAEDVERAGQELLERLAARAVLITRGQEGMSLVTADGAPRHLPSAPTAAVDPTGAGDTVAAAFTLAVVAGASFAAAAELASLAAAVVVARVGTATSTAADLLAAVAAAGGPA